MTSLLTQHFPRIYAHPHTEVEQRKGTYVCAVSTGFCVPDQNVGMIYQIYSSSVY